MADYPETVARTVFDVWVEELRQAPRLMIIPPEMYIPPWL